MATGSTKDALKLTMLIEEFRKLDTEMQAQQMLIFLTVLDRPNIGMRVLEDIVGLTSASVSRNVAAMSKVHRKGKPGHDLFGGL